MLIKGLTTIALFFCFIGSAYAELPNIVLIMSDDLGYYDTDLYAQHPLHQTPNLKTLASRGVLFTRSYSCPLCSPTRSQIMTGQHAARTGFTGALGHQPEVILKATVEPTASPNLKIRKVNSTTRMRPTQYTLADQLKAYGYKTGHFGKWHLGDNNYLPVNFGFDVQWPGLSNAGPPNGYFNKYNQHIEDETAAKAVEFIEQNKERPFFLNYWQWSVHSPFEAKPELIRQYQNKIRANPKELGKYNGLYAAMVKTLDINVGRIVRAIEAKGLTDNTIIIFCSDNGGLEKPRKGFTPTDNEPLRGGKATLWEGGIRTPMIVVWPKHVEPGTSHQLVQSLDLYPTIVDMIGRNVHKDKVLDGQSFRPALYGVPLNRAMIFNYFPQRSNVPDDLQPSICMHAGQWKLIKQYHNNNDQSHEYYLYDLSRDEGEVVDLASVRPDVVATLAGHMAAFEDNVGAVVPPKNRNFRQRNP